MQKRINKHVFTWVGTFLFGIIGVDRFMRGQIGLGILKLVIGLAGVWLFGLGAVWALIDWIIALTKLDQYEEDFVFDYHAGKDGQWDKSYTKEAIEKRVRENAAYELQEKRREEEQKERREKYKKDILSGAISYDDELQKITDALSKYRPYLKEKGLELADLARGLSTGNYAIKNADIESPPDVDDKLFVLGEIKHDARIDALKKESSSLRQTWGELYSTLHDAKLRFNLY